MNFIAQLLPYFQVILAVLLTIAVLLQRSDAGVGGAFGGGDSFGGYRFTKRGLEKTLFQTTIFLSVLLVFSAVLALFL